MIDLGKSFRRGWKVYVKIVAVVVDPDNFIC